MVLYFNIGLAAERNTSRYIPPHGGDERLVHILVLLDNHMLVAPHGCFELIILALQLLLQRSQHFFGGSLVTPGCCRYQFNVRIQRSGLTSCQARIAMSLLEGKDHFLEELGVVEVIHRELECTKSFMMTIGCNGTFDVGLDGVHQLYSGSVYGKNLINGKSKVVAYDNGGEVSGDSSC